MYTCMYVCIYTHTYTHNHTTQEDIATLIKPTRKSSYQYICEPKGHGSHITVFIRRRSNLHSKPYVRQLSLPFLLLLLLVAL